MIKIMTDKMLNERLNQARNNAEEQMWQRQRMNDVDKQLWELAERIRKIECRLDGNEPVVLERMQTERSE